MAAKMERTHGDVLDAIRQLVGKRVRVQMRTGVAGDYVNARGVLEGLRAIEEEGTMLILDSGVAAVLHLHPLGSSPVEHRSVSSDFIRVVYANGCEFHCAREEE